MSAKEVFGVAKGLGKVATAYSTELGIEFQKAFSIIGALGGRQAIEARFKYYSEGLHGLNKEDFQIPPHPYHVEDYHYIPNDNETQTKSSSSHQSDSSSVIRSHPHQVAGNRHYHTLTVPRSLLLHNHTHHGWRFSGTDEVVNASDSSPSKTVGSEGAAVRKKLPKLHSRAKERPVPVSRISRIAKFGGLAAGLGVGTAKELAKRALGISDQGDSPASNVLLSEDNLERVVDTLCRVRGAALKLGQMISLQDSAVISPQVQEIFERVRSNADIMPAWQMEGVLSAELGSDWKEKLTEFDPKPLAAASIGQVHRAVTKDGREVAMKIQYPGVAQSINSDIDNIIGLLNLWNIMPEGLFVKETVDVMRKELAWEVNYLREAECSRKFRSLLADDPGFVVPEVLQELTTERVLTAELISGVPLDECTHFSQDIKNDIAQRIMNLCLREMFEFRFMQTDPNWSNFYYNDQNNKIYLLDFGATRGYPKEFMNNYMKIIHATAVKDEQTVQEVSKDLGFLTGYETKNLIQAHVEAVMILGEPFAEDKVFDFGKQNTTTKIQKLMPALVKDRLTPPPEECYSIHRKSAGAFLLCAKLNAQINCYHMFKNIYDKYNL